MRVELRVIALCLATLLCSAASATAYRCPSPNGKSYVPLVEAASPEEALQVTLQRWTLVGISKPTSCLPEEESNRRQADEAQRHREEFMERNAPRDDCPGSADSLFKGIAGEFAVAAARVMFPRPTCSTTLTVRQQLFVIGVGEQLAERCGISYLNIDSPERQFLIFGAGAGLQGYIEPSVRKSTTANLAAMMSAIADASATLLIGERLVSALPDSACNSLPAKWFTGLHDYLTTTRTVYAGRTFVTTCENAYRGTWTADKCSCVAEAMRFSTPNIHELVYSQQLLDAHANLFTFGGLVGCGAINTTPPPPTAEERATARMQSNRLRQCNNESKRLSHEERQAYMKTCMSHP